MVNPPTLDRISQRAFILAAITHRAFMEFSAGQPGVESECKMVLDLLHQRNLENELEPSEKEILQTPLGKLTERQTVDSSWRCEGLAVLAWAISYFNLPAYDEQVNPKEVTESVFFTNKTVALRNFQEINAFADMMLSLRWRLVEYSLRPKKIFFDTHNATAWFGHRKENELRIINGDLAIGTNEISHAPIEDFRRCMSIACERQRAANWLIGNHAIYSKVDVDT